MNEGWYFYRKQQWFLCLCLCSEQGLVGLSEKVHICVCSVAHSCLTLVTPSTVAFQAPLSMGFPRQDYWSGLPCPPPGDLPDPGMEPALVGGFFITSPPGKAQ